MAAALVLRMSDGTLRALPANRPSELISVEREIIAHGTHDGAPVISGEVFESPEYDFRISARARVEAKKATTRKTK